MGGRLTASKSNLIKIGSYKLPVAKCIKQIWRPIDGVGLGSSYKLNAKSRIKLTFIHLISLDVAGGTEGVGDPNFPA